MLERKKGNFQDGTRWTLATICAYIVGTHKYPSAVDEWPWLVLKVEEICRGIEAWRDPNVDFI
jgi:hypothetical protein